MTKSFYRVLFVALTLFMALPCPVLAQQTEGLDKAASGQTQSDNQSRKKQRQWRRGGMQRQRQHMARLAKDLNLTDGQKQQFQQIGQETRKKGAALRQDSSLTEDQKKEKMQELRKQSHQQMFGVLTQEQKDKLKQMREQHKKDHEKAPGDQASGKSKTSAGDDDDPFAGMTSDDEEGPVSGAGF
ncbi:MAG TPA: hypothetical protein VE133_15515 [Candidatus Sulfotelmatobacter sp.]|nr:hypothetical protein [Candidatus Sulfotelmatobacter sp.]